MFADRCFCVVHLDPIKDDPYCPICMELRTWAGDICRICDTDLLIYDNNACTRSFFNV